MASNNTPLSSRNNTRLLRSAESEDKPSEIRVGHEYQAVIPDFVPKRRRTDNDLPKLCESASWVPCGNYTEKELITYVSVTKKVCKISIDQALAFLLHHNGNIKEAMKNMGNFTNISKVIGHEKTLAKYDKYEKSFDPKEYDLDESYIKAMKCLKVNSMIDNILLWNCEQIKKEDDVESKTENPHFELCNGEELLKLYHTLGNARVEFSADDILAKEAKAVMEDTNIKRMIVECEAEIELVHATPIETEKVKVQANWTEEDKALLSLAYADYKDDYEAIAYIIGNKTADQVSEYCITHYGSIDTD